MPQLAVARGLGEMPKPTLSTRRRPHRRRVQPAAQAAMDSSLGSWIPQVTICHCHRLEEVREAVEAVRARHCVLLHADNAPRDEAQRIVDFLSGAIYALDGQVDRIGARTVLLSPAGVNVSHS